MIHDTLHFLKNRCGKKNATNERACLDIIQYRVSLKLYCNIPNKWEQLTTSPFWLKSINKYKSLTIDVITITWTLGVLRERVKIQHCLSQREE